MDLELVEHPGLDEALRGAGAAPIATFLTPGGGPGLLQRTGMPSVTKVNATSPLGVLAGGLLVSTKWAASQAYQ